MKIDRTNVIKPVQSDSISIHSKCDYSRSKQSMNEPSEVNLMVYASELRACFSLNLRFKSSICQQFLCWVNLYLSLTSIGLPTMDGEICLRHYKSDICFFLFFFFRKKIYE